MRRRTPKERTMAQNKWRRDRAKIAANCEHEKTSESAMEAFKRPAFGVKKDNR